MLDRLVVPTTGVPTAGTGGEVDEVFNFKPHAVAALATETRYLPPTARDAQAIMPPPLSSFFQLRCFIGVLRRKTAPALRPVP